VDSQGYFILNLGDEFRQFQPSKGLTPDFSPRFSKLAYKPCQMGFSGKGQKKQSVIFPNQPRIKWGLGLNGFSQDL
jgi:hypothetical protein